MSTNNRSSIPAFVVRGRRVPLPELLEAYELLTSQGMERLLEFAQRETRDLVVLSSPVVELEVRCTFDVEGPANDNGQDRQVSFELRSATGSATGTSRASDTTTTTLEVDLSHTDVDAELYDIDFSGDSDIERAYHFNFHARYGQ